MIKSFSVEALNGSLDYALIFNEDLNIITGENGSGKTSLLRLLWYIISGNIERTVPEIDFRVAHVIGDRFEVLISLSDVTKESQPEATIRWKAGSGSEQEVSFSVTEWDQKRSWGVVDAVNRDIASYSGSSFYFPTFRRIEGGLSGRSQHMHEAEYDVRGPANSIRTALKSYENLVSVWTHRFIATVSTDDIEHLLTQRYADLTEKTEMLHRQLSQFIIEKIDDIDMGSGQEATKIGQREEALRRIREEVNRINHHVDETMAPFYTLSNIVKAIFRHSGIAISKNIVLGDKEGAIRSEKLSAGEKQMLGFFCYNTVVANTTLFIDEPEIGLHADWQRLLFPTLLKQSRSNQFIIATHSPMIYSKYPEKEFDLGKVAKRA